MRVSVFKYFFAVLKYLSIQINVANIEFSVPYAQRYLFNAIPNTNHNANPTNPNRISNGNPNSTDSTNPTNPTNPNTMYRCEYGTLNSMFAINVVVSKDMLTFTEDVGLVLPQKCVHFTLLSDNLTTPVFY